FGYQYDASVKAGVSDNLTFHVIELRLTEQHNSITMSGFDDAGQYDSGPRPYYWNIAADPLQNPDVEIANGSVLFTEYTTPDEVPAGNNAPAATDDSATTGYETAVTIDVLANDTDADSDPLTVSAVGTAANGTVEIVDGQVVYTPNAGFSGSDSFTYTVSDDEGATDTGNVSVTVGDAPTPSTPVVSITADKTVVTEDGLDAVTFTINVQNLPADGLRVGLGAFRAGEDGAENTFKFGIAEFALLPYVHTNPDGSTTVLRPSFSGIASPVGWDKSDGLSFTVTSETATITMPLWPDPEDLKPGETNFFRNSDTGVDTITWRLVDYQNTAFGGALGEYEVAPGQGVVEMKLKDNADQTYEANDVHATASGRAVEIDFLAANPDAVEIVSVEDSSTSRQGLMEHGAAVIDDKGTADKSDDTIVYTPTAGYVGRDYFSVLVRNANGDLDQARVTVDVTELTNQNPAAVDDTAETGAGAAVTIDVTANDTDGDGDALTVTEVGTPTNGAVEIVDGQVVYTPNAGFSGSDSFSYTISDGQGGTATGNVSVTVNDAPNANPVAVDDAVSTGFGETVVIDVLANDTDADSETLTVTEVGTATNGAVEIIDGRVAYNPNEGFAGTDSFTYIISDGEGGSATGTVTVTVNDAPNATPKAEDDSVTTAYGAPVTVDVLANDSDENGETLTITEVGTAANGTVEIVDGQVVYTPNAGFSGDDSFSYTITDGKETATANVAVTVSPASNTDPVAVDDTASTSSGQSVIVNVLANDTDAEGHALTVTEVGTATNGTVELTAGEVIYTPNAGFSGDDSFTYAISDGNGGTATGSVTVTVMDAPNASPNAVDDAVTTAYGVPVTVDVLANDSDENGDTLTVTEVGTAANGTVEIIDGQVVYTPNAGFSGDDSFSYTITDGKETATANVAVTVSEEQTPQVPIVGVTVDNNVVTEDGADAITLTFNVENMPADGVRVSLATYRGDASGADTAKYGLTQFVVIPEEVPGVGFLYPVLDGVSDVIGWDDSDGLTFTLTKANATVTLPVWPDPEDKLPGSEGYWRNEDVGVDSVTWRLVDFVNSQFGDPVDNYQVAEGQGSVSMTLMDNGEDSYEAGDDHAVANGGPVEIDVMANDGEAVEIVAFEDGANAANGLLQNGTLSLDDKGTADKSDDTLVYTPNAGFTGRDAFNYVVRNANGQLDQARVTVDVSAGPGNQTPAAVDDAVSTDSGVPVTVDVLANDTDGDGDTLTVTEVGAAANGTVEIVDGQVVYTPNDGFSGDDSFSYTISDGKDGTATANVSVSVGAAVNLPPQAADDSVTTAYGAPVTVDVLANDIDAEGETLTVTGVGAASNGVAELVDGQVIYTPNAGFSGSDSFTYAITDAAGGTAEATVNVTVEAEGTELPTILGTDGDDVMRAPETGAILDGLEGRDIYYAGAGADVLKLGDGDKDQFRQFDAANDKLDVSAWGVQSFEELSIYDQGPLVTIFDRASGNAAYSFDANLSASDLTADNFIFAPAENLTVSSEAGGSEAIYGRSGDDVISGGPGYNRLFGQGGADTFVIGTGRGDVVMDFQDGVDRFDISSWGVSSMEDLQVSEYGGQIAVTVGHQFALRIEKTDGLTLADIGADDFIFSNNVI
ncbi:MAG: Ig-like domain-containing protein, partial [Pikeienuella sp.]